MLVRKKIDYYPILAILFVFAIDLTVFFLSSSFWIPLLWAIASLNTKGWICSWNHHHQHYKFFRDAWANRLIEVVMGLQTGVLGEVWVLHHALGHHVNYLDQTKDESAWKDTSGRIMAHLEYSLKNSLMTYPIALQVGKKHRRSRKKLIQNICLTTLLLAIFAAINWVNTLIIFVVPMVFLLFMTVHVTYYHHAGLDHEDPYQATYNIMDRWYNFFTCNLGYHTAHHLQCGRHWSELPKFHEEIKEKIPSHLYREAGFPFSLMTKLEKALTR